MVVVVALFAVSATSAAERAGTTRAARTQQEPGLPGSSADASKPGLQKNEAAGAAPNELSADGPSTPPLDNFNRPDEPVLYQRGAWSLSDPIGGGNTFRVASNQAATDDNNNVSYRLQVYPGDVEEYATIAAKPDDGGAVGLVLDIRDDGGYGWDSYWLTWDALSGTDTLRIEKETNNANVNLVTTQLEMSAGDASSPDASEQSSRAG